MDIWTIGKILAWTAEYFAKNGIESPRLDAEVLLSHVLQKERIYLYVHFDEPLNKDELAFYKECVKKRSQKIPIAYIIGKREFMGLDFMVTQATLIPRPDTEILVEESIGRLRNFEGSNIRIADLGTGSGAICLSVLDNISNATAIAVDISADALEVARRNAEAIGVADRVEFVQGDMIEAISGMEPFDAIVSNPPYIKSGDIPTLAPDVRCYEPVSALDGGTDGMDFYRRLVSSGPKFLNGGGFLAVEMGIGQVDGIRAMAHCNPAWKSFDIIKDLAGIDRCAVLSK